MGLFPFLSYASILLGFFFFGKAGKSLEKTVHPLILLTFTSMIVFVFRLMRLFW